MIDYIRFYEDESILTQLPYGFKSAAILLHPFIQMLLGWEQNKRKNQFEHIYPNDKEIMQYGTPVSWEKIRRDCGFNSI